MTDAGPLGADETTFVAAVRPGDPARFARMTERHRRELQVHCYRMLAKYEDTQDLTQETFLRAWNKRESFQDHAALRSAGVAPGLWSAVGQWELIPSHTLRPYSAMSVAATRSDHHWNSSSPGDESGPSPPLQPRSSPGAAM